MSLLSTWRASQAFSIAQRRLTKAKVDQLNQLAQAGSPAIEDAIEQFSVLPDEDELVNTLDILTSVSVTTVSKEASIQAEKTAMWAPATSSDQLWSKSRKRKVSEFKDEFAELELKHLSTEEQLNQYQTWLKAHRKPPTMFSSPESVRSQRAAHILCLPSTAVAKSICISRPSIASFQMALSLLPSGRIPQASSQTGHISAVPIVNTAQPSATAAPGEARKQSPSLADLKTPLKWSSVDSVMVLSSPSIPSSSKLAAFDMDHTLIEPKSGRQFPTNAADWKWRFPEVKPRLLELYKQGYNIVIFSNQSGVTKGKQDPEHLKQKILQIASDLGIPIQAFLATADDKYRKPNTALWDLYQQKFSPSTPISLNDSFYCGDAAGRAPAPPRRPKKDFSCTDRAFASNIGVAFHTESEFFLNEPAAPFSWDSIDPHSVLLGVSPNNLIPQTPAESWHKPTQEMVMLIGPPGSGKSTFTKRFLIPHGYVHVNRDTLHSQAACIAATKAAISSGKSVVIDNTNPGKEARASFIQIALDNGVPVRCFRFTTDIELAKHLNMYREKTQGIPHVPDVGYNIFKSRLEEPSKAEGFQSIEQVPFRPMFNSEAELKAFLQRT